MSRGDKEMIDTKVNHEQQYQKYKEIFASIERKTIFDTWLRTDVRKRLKEEFPKLRIRRKKYNCSVCCRETGRDVCTADSPCKTLMTIVTPINPVDQMTDWLWFH